MLLLKRGNLQAHATAPEQDNIGRRFALGHPRLVDGMVLELLPKAGRDVVHEAGRPFGLQRHPEQWRISFVLSLSKKNKLCATLMSLSITCTLLDCSP
jgi:hypothetical protein